MSLRKAVYVIAAARDHATERKIVVRLLIAPVRVVTIQGGRRSHETTIVVAAVCGEWAPP